MFLSHLLWGKFIHPFSPTEGKKERRKSGERSKKLRERLRRRTQSFPRDDFQIRYFALPTHSFVRRSNESLRCGALVAGPPPNGWMPAKTDEERGQRATSFPSVKTSAEVGEGIFSLGLSLTKLPQREDVLRPRSSRPNEPCFRHRLCCQKGSTNTYKRDFETHT